MSQQSGYETRAERRQRAREAAKLLLKSKNQAGEDFRTKDIVLWCLAGVMAVALYLAPEKTPLWVILGLLCMGALATYPTLHLPWVTKAASGKSKAIRALTVMLGMAVVVGLYVGLYGLFRTDTN